METLNDIKNEKLERKLKIIGYAKLELLTPQTVENLYKGIYEYLIEEERYEECAIIKRKKEKFDKALKI